MWHSHLGHVLTSPMTQKTLVAVGGFNFCGTDTALLVLGKRLGVHACHLLR
jgi:hypothetical protein